MDAKDLFTLALQLSPEWKVTDCLLDQEDRCLTLKLDFSPGSKFSAPGADHQLLCAVHDTVEKRWRHLDFFQYKTELVARVPRVKTPEGKVVQVEVPWARPGSGFTLLFEAYCCSAARCRCRKPDACCGSRTRGSGESSSTTWSRHRRNRAGARCGGSLLMKPARAVAIAT